MALDTPQEWGAVLGSALFLAFSSWRIRRNSLPDEERARLFWNDERYERLQRGFSIFLWSWAAILAVAVVFVYGLMLWAWLDGGPS